MAERMKPSGIDWIGDIPASWKRSKVKFCFSLVNGSTPESSDYDCWDGDIKWITPADMSDTGTISHGERLITKYGYNSCGTTLLPIGSIVISSRAPIGKINITTAELCTNQGCKSLIRTGDNRYFYYLFLAGQHELSLLGRGTTFLELSTYDLNGFGLVIPAEDEQKAIADFLDKECAQIDSIAADLGKQIELLQQYKRSLITETVTKGLDKSVPIKDSGVEWIGEIPEHWRLKRLKYIAKLKTGTTPPGNEGINYDENGINWFTPSDFLPNMQLDTSEKYIDRETIRYSSTAGTAMEAVTYALSESRKLSEATPVDVSEEEKSMGDIIEDEIARSGKQPNVSMIAFTATPKPTTLQLFGCLNEEGKKVAFDLYSMKQAIEEGFILDVLQNYVTYKTYFEINKAIEDDPELETIAAKRKIAKYIELHDTNIAQKVEIIIEHFKNRIMQELGGKAKAMVITSSRQAAVKYRNEFEAYISKHGYTGIRALVAFSGKVSLDGHEYTEAVMNGIKEEDLPDVFDSNSYQVLLVANKYQTGFDQPKLCAMYVDKRLRGVNAVQTLSRLNRICAPYDKKTFVMDFKNEYEDIQASFAPFYTETILNETITPSDIRAVEAQVDQYNFLDIDDIEEFNGYLYQDKRTSKEKARMWALLDKSLQIINRHPELEKLEIRATIKRFLRFYSFLIQATCFESVDLHKKYNFISYLVKAIDASPELRSKKQLIETFIAGINDVDDVVNEWHEYVVEQRDHDLNAIITEEKLKPEDTRKFMENAFRDGEIKTAGTDVDKLMPPISRFGSGGRAKKKQCVIDKLKTFFEKYFGIGGSSTFTELEHKTVNYDMNSQKSLSMVAEPKTPYGK